MVLRLTKTVACTVISQRLLTQEDRDQNIDVSVIRSCS